MKADALCTEQSVSATPYLLISILTPGNSGRSLALAAASFAAGIIRLKSTFSGCLESQWHQRRQVGASTRYN